ncbi:MAG: hypothetical protein KDM64_17940, partial [Verrucomicrobiae bacterium]|nr:hypothetical protein [Verrucomicrobiae bacterium]
LLGADGTRTLRGSVNLKTGLFSAVATDSGSKFRVKLLGVVFQKQQIAGGYYRNKETAGSVLLEAKP